MVTGTDTMKINAMALVTTEDLLYMVTDTNQLLKVQINLDGSLEEVKANFEYVICQFHSKAITGLDTCIRKELVVTCSRDKTIRVWSYQHNTLELTYPASEEILSVAFHPSGFHILAAQTDKVFVMNVLSKKIESFTHTQAKQCKEIQFSNGGHLYACVNVNAIYVYNFYTNEPVVTYKDHNNKPKCIEWFPDDSGFVSCGQDGSIYFCPLYSVDQTGKGQRDFDSDIVNKQVTFFCVAQGTQNSQGKIFSTASDRYIREHEKTKEDIKLETGSQISQILLSANGKILFGGSSDEGKPGSVHIYRTPLEKVTEVQAHSKPIERMRLSFDNDFLFTAGQDGCIIVHSVKDRGQGGLKREARKLKPSEEILTEKDEIQGYIQDRDQKQQELQNMSNPDNIDGVLNTNDQDVKLATLAEEKANMTLQHNNRYEALLENKKEMETAFEERIKKLQDEYLIDMDEKRNEYAQKMLEDSAKFTSLQNEKNADADNFREQLEKVNAEH